MAEFEKPYVVSGDVQLLLTGWAEKRGFYLPNQAFFNTQRRQLKMALSDVVGPVDFVPELEIKQGLAEMVSRCGLQPVSIDRVYYPSKPSLDLTRLVDSQGNDQGLGPRANTPTIKEQLTKLRDLPIREIALVDDVIFSGSLLVKVCNMLADQGIKVSLICAGIGIDEGIEKLNGTKRPVECVRRYNQVVDEVCERDFYPGVPFSGRTVTGSLDMGAPYLLPFGNPVDWASIPPAEAPEFSRFCVRQTVALFEAIEDNSRRYVKCQDLDRKVLGLPTDQTRFVEALKGVL